MSVPSYFSSQSHRKVNGHLGYFQVTEATGAYEAASNRDINEITPMHAAAVNGDKSSLAKLIVG